MNEKDKKICDKFIYLFLIELINLKKLELDSGEHDSLKMLKYYDDYEY